MSGKENESPVLRVRRGAAAGRGLKSSASVNTAANVLPGRSTLPAKLTECESPSEMTEEFSMADVLQAEPPADSDEENEEETELMPMPDLLQASTAEARARPRTGKSRMSLGGSFLKKAARVNAEGRTVGVARAASRSSPRKRVRARPSPRGKKLQSNPDPLPILNDDEPSPEVSPEAAPAAVETSELMKVFAQRSHSRPEVSLQKVDLLSLIDKIPNIAEEWDRLHNGSLDRREDIQARMIESGKFDSLIDIFREARSTMIAELTEKQQIVYNQWQKIGELELGAASSEALGAQNRCLEREITGLQSAKTLLETENTSLKESLNDANQELATAVRQSTMTSQTHQQKLKSYQATIDNLKADVAHAHEEAAEEACSAATELKNVTAKYEQQLEDLQTAKDDGVALADQLTKTLEDRLTESAAEIDSTQKELAAVTQEFERKLAVSEEELQQTQASVSNLEAQLANKEAEVAEATQHSEDMKAELENQLAASENKISSTNETVLAVKEQLTHEQEARAAAEASLKTQTEVTIPSLKQTVDELNQQVAGLESTAAADLKTSQDAHDAAEKEIAELKGRLHDTTELASSLRNEINNSQEDKKSMGEELAELKQKLETATSTSEELTARLAGMEAKSAAAHGENDRLLNELEEANTMQQRFAQQVEVLAKQMKETASDIEQLRGEKEAEIAKAAAMAEQFEPLREEVNALQKDKRELADEKERMEIRIKLLEENSSDAGLAQLSLATDNEFAKKQHGSLIEELEQLREKVGQQADQLMKQTNQIIDGERQRKKMHNTICELKGNIRVFCRVRPMMDHDGDSTTGALRYPKSTVDDKEAIEVVGDEGVKTQFGFDKVFPERSSQLQIFNEVSSLVQSAIDGYRCCIFAYGQTGTGKTHTMQGATGEERGIIPRSLEMIVAETQRLKLQGWEYTLHASFLEIHNENLRDLLADPTAPKADLKIRHMPNGKTVVTNAVEEEIAANAGDIASLMQRAQLQRSVGFTDMNAASSRSHAVFRLRLEGSKGDVNESVSGVLNLIDLAGSERLNSSHATGERLKETQAINKSLSALGDVFAALVNNADKHIPFRNSKLTYLLEPCLGGNSKTLMLSNISPAQTSAGESICSLRFASRVNKCELGRAKRQESNPSENKPTKRPGVQTRRGSKVDAAEAAAASKAANVGGGKPAGRRNPGMANVRPTSKQNKRPRRGDHTSSAS